METNVLERASRTVADTVQEHGPRGIGASITRNEDARFLAGKGEYLADLNIPGTGSGFPASPVAHGIIRNVDIPPESCTGSSCCPILATSSRSAPFSTIPISVARIFTPWHPTGCAM